MNDQRLRMELSDENRIGRHWDAGNMSVFVYATPGQAVLRMGCRPAGYTDPAQVRELAAWLLAAADRMESQ
jgi:hypothetical protein